LKNVAMIPVLLGSTRIPGKNLILVDGHPLISYVVRACQESGMFDEIYINSENELFRQIAQMLGVSFYQRQPQRGGSACEMSNKSRQCQSVRCQTHDHFLFDIMEKLGPCNMAMVHTTSPLVRPETIKSFMDLLEKDGYDSLFSVEQRFVESRFDGQPLNYSTGVKAPTQTLQPIQMLTWGLSAWKTQSFMDSYLRDDPNESGPTFCGKTGVFPLDRIESLDADNWDDLYMVEACLQHRRQGTSPGEHRFTDDILSIEWKLEDLIGGDGVGKYEGAGANSRLSNLEEIKKQMGPAPWIYVLVYNATAQIGIICQNPGEGARKHKHVTHAEWWIVLQGSFDWHCGDGTVISGKKSDVICLQPGMSHQIICTSEEPGIRLACGARDFEHIYVC
jgi:CMP-N-acetylneuraminic acid synthetase/quercetin dioxygenase-like cupin family protein